MTTNATPATFNWVEARLKCSAKAMFEELRQLAQFDAATRNKVFPGTEVGQGDRFQFKDSPNKGEWIFSVWDRYGRERRATDFRLDGEVLHVTPTEGRPFQATLTLTDAGECKFKVGDEELYPWQLLRRALEGLFFNWM